MRIHPLVFIFIMFVMMTFAYVIGSIRPMTNELGEAVGEWMITTCMGQRGMTREACASEIKRVVFGIPKADEDGGMGGVFEK